jgi:hypothetical protein
MMTKAPPGTVNVRPIIAERARRRQGVICAHGDAQDMKLDTGILS